MFTVLVLVYLVVSVNINHVVSSELIRRDQWNARQPTQPLMSLAEKPAPFVTVHHSEGSHCKKYCPSVVKAIQNYHMDNNRWIDIGYNFLVGGDGKIYEGRGWGIHGAHAIPMNRRSIGVCFLGTFKNSLPNDAAMKAFNDLVGIGIKEGHILEDYKIVGHRQVSETDCPGNKLYQLINSWDRWTDEAD